MALIDSTYFDGELMLPGISSLAVQAAITMAINSYEPELLEKVMGRVLYAAFVAGIAAGSVDNRWLWIRDGHTYTYAGKTFIWKGLINSAKQSPIAAYVYYQYRSVNATQSTTSAETVNKQENADVIAPTVKLVRAWNKMVTSNHELVHMLRFLKDTDGITPTYPEWDVRVNRSVFCKQNNFGI